MQKIWYRKGESAWFLTIKENGKQKQLRLLRGPNDRDTRKKAEGLAIQELANRKSDPTPATPSWITVGNILDGFLDHSKEEHDSSTYEWYKYFFDSFRKKTENLRITLLKKHHIQAWVKEHGFSDTSANRVIGAIKRAFAWAVEEEYISRSPIEHVRKPTGKTRDRILTTDERELIMSSIPDEAFRDYVNALGLTGARPGEIRKVTGQDVDIERGMWVLKKHKTAKKTGKDRMIYLCPEALELTKKVMARNPEGPIFRNTRGVPWTKNAIRLRFTKLRKKHPQLKGIISYTYRSSFATDALEAGVPDTTVAALLGHTNPSTLHRFYARLSHKVKHLQAAAGKAIQDRPGVGDAPPDTPA
jgi:integrase